MRIQLPALYVMLTLLVGCASPVGPGTATAPGAPPAAIGAQRATQLERLKVLLRDPAFALEMARALDAAYYVGQGQAVAPFLKAEEESATTNKSLRDEKIAINLAGFYALEGGVGYIAQRDRRAPVDVLTALTTGQLADGDMLLLARFANATWKAGQPFRALSRISRDTFGPAALLSDTELRKDFVQIKAAAAKLVQAMEPAKSGDTAAQLARLQMLLRDTAFALDMAQSLDAAYYIGQGQAAPAFLKPEELTASNAKSVREEKIAINLAGFYALEAGIGIISERGRETPLQIIDSIADGTRPATDMLLLARLANATWKAGQPFRALSRITRDTFKPAALLSPADVQKDIDQIRAAALRLGQKMRSAS